MHLRSISIHLALTLGLLACSRGEPLADNHAPIVDPGCGGGGEPVCSDEAPLVALCSELCDTYLVVDGETTCECCEPASEPQCSDESPTLALCANWCDSWLVVDGMVTCECCEDPTEPPMCGGFANIPCDGGLVCIDDPRDDCEMGPHGGADCSGICVEPPMCGGFAGLSCPEGLTCVADPANPCEGEPDCAGICLP